MSAVDRLRRLTALFPALVLARRNLKRAPARTTLAVVAIVIGVIAVGGIGTGGEAFKQDQAEAYEGFGGTVTVDPVFYPDAADENRNFSDRDVARMRQVTEGATVQPVIQPGGLFRGPDGEPSVTTSIRGLEDPGAFYEAQAGAIPPDPRRSIVVGSRVASENEIQPGDRVEVLIAGQFARSYRVSAVLEPQGFADPLRADQSVFLPLSEFEDAGYDQVILSVDPQRGSASGAADRVEAEFNSRRRNVEATANQERQQAFEESFELINQFLIGVGAISLLVAAFTIANTMLMSAVERESEIGVLRAAGYPKLAVVRLLLAEAAMLGLVGAALGIPITLGIGMAINQVLVGDPLAFTGAGLRYVALGAGFGIVTALVAGVYPAWKAANKRPVEVLG